MSAAEKLKALIERPVGSNAEYLATANDLADVLPEIIAVLKAVEEEIVAQEGEVLNVLVDSYDALEAKLELQSDH